MSDALKSEGVMPSCYWAYSNWMRRSCDFLNLRRLFVRMLPLPGLTWKLRGLGINESVIVLFRYTLKLRRCDPCIDPRRELLCKLKCVLVLFGSIFSFSFGMLIGGPEGLDSSGGWLVVESGVSFPVVVMKF